MIVAIAGATGVVGSRVLDLLLKRPDVTRVVALGRRPMDRNAPGLEDRPVDMQSHEAMRGALPEGVSVAFCCLGTTMKQAGSKEAFRAVDHDAVLAFARAVKERGARHFLLVSALGADAESGNFYLRTKGETEDALQALGFEHLTVVRPSLIDDEGSRDEVRLGERIGLWAGRALFAVIGRRRKYAPVKAGVIAMAMVRLGFGPARGPLRIVESDEIQTLGA